MEWIHFLNIWTCFKAIQEIGRLTEPPEIKRRDEITEELNNFVVTCLTINPSDRPDATTILQVTLQTLLNHATITCM